MNKTGRYIRKPVDDAESLALMEEHGVGYSSTGLVARMRANGNIWQEGVRLAGVCNLCTNLWCPQKIGISLSKFPSHKCLMRLLCLSNNVGVFVLTGCEGEAGKSVWVLLGGGEGCANGIRGPQAVSQLEAARHQRDHSQPRSQPGKQPASAWVSIAYK